MDRLGTTDSFGFGVETSVVLSNGPSESSDGGRWAVGAICGGGTEPVRARSGEMRVERRDFRSGVAGTAGQGSERVYERFSNVKALLRK